MLNNAASVVNKHYELSHLLGQENTQEKRNVPSINTGPARGSAWRGTGRPCSGMHSASLTIDFGFSRRIW